MLISYHTHKSDAPQGMHVRARAKECAFAVTQLANHIGSVPHSETVDTSKVLLQESQSWEVKQHPNDMWDQT